MGHRLPLCPGFELLYRWITTLAKGDIDSLHDDVVDFTPLVKGGFVRYELNRNRSPTYLHDVQTARSAVLLALYKTGERPC